MNGSIPCIGIVVLLSNLKPLVNEDSITSWQKGKGLMRPEIFHNRWRTDRDPTRSLEFYSAPAPSRNLKQSSSQQLEAVDATIFERDFALNMAKIQALDPLAKQHALRGVSELMHKMKCIVGKFELDVMLAKTNQVHTCELNVRQMYCKHLAHLLTLFS